LFENVNPLRRKGVFFLPEKIELPMYVDVAGSRRIVYAVREDGLWDRPVWVLCYYVGDVQCPLTTWHRVEVWPTLPPEAMAHGYW
jgi:hypothetical protein